MANIIYGKLGGENNAAIGKIDTPIKMVIEHESNLCEKNNIITKNLFNVEKSKKFGETIVGQSGFDSFMAVKEGQGAENDTIVETYKKFIEHIQFMKEFTITAEMLEDSNYGVGSDAKRRAEAFTRAYYNTQNKLAAAALYNGTKLSMTFNRASVDLTVGDGNPLFYNAHTYAEGSKAKGTQSNRYWANITDITSFEENLNKATNALRNYKDENGDVMGYVADTLILPGNSPSVESWARKVCGSERVAGSNNNDINIQYGNWNLVVIPEWQLGANESGKFMIMSSEANKNLAGNMFFNRVPLTLNSWVDHHTGNYIWNGRCRFGVGFGSWKHIALIEIASTAVTGATAL